MTSLAVQGHLKNLLGAAGFGLGRFFFRLIFLCGFLIFFGTVIRLIKSTPLKNHSRAARNDTADGEALTFRAFADRLCGNRLEHFKDVPA